jgi:hypothetical protein
MIISFLFKMTLPIVIVKRNDQPSSIIDLNPWWNRNQIREVVDDDGNVALQLKTCRAILCEKFDEPSLADTCLSFLPIEVQISINSHNGFNSVQYTIFLPFQSETVTINQARWPLQQVSVRGEPCKSQEAEEYTINGMGNLQDAKRDSTSLSMMSTGWTIITWWEDSHYMSILSDTKGRCRAFYKNIEDENPLDSRVLRVLSDFRIVNKNGSIQHNQYNHDWITVIDLSDPPFEGDWYREHYFWNHRLVFL